MNNGREQLGSRLGFILLSAGCAIGCGNVWKFPWMTGQYGGGYMWRRKLESFWDIFKIWGSEKKQPMMPMNRRQPSDSLRTNTREALPGDSLRMNTREAAPNDSTKTVRNEVQ